MIPDIIDSDECKINWTGINVARTYMVIGIIKRMDDSIQSFSLLKRDRKEAKKDNLICCVNQTRFFQALKEKGGQQLQVTFFRGKQQILYDVSVLIIIFYNIKNKITGSIPWFRVPCPIFPGARRPRVLTRALWERQI